MKIALLGAPGSGKTELAKALARSLNREKTDLKWVVIDGYVEALAARTGRQYGVEGDIPHNIQVMAERWTKEAEARHKGYATITCGSIYETMVYTALTRLQPPPEEELLVRFMHEARVSMQFLGLMEQMSFSYEALFYLPLPMETRQHDWPSVIDEKLPHVLDGVRYAVPLTGTTRQKAKHALAVIRSVREHLVSLETPEAE